MLATALAVAHSAYDPQRLLDNLNNAYTRLGLKINAGKTKVLVQPAPGVDVPEPDITIGDERVETVSHFIYLGSIVSKSAMIDEDIRLIKARLRSASAAFYKLRSRVFDVKELKRTTKIAVYKAVVLPTLLYGCEAWVTYRRHIKYPEHSFVGTTNKPQCS